MNVRVSIVCCLLFSLVSSISGFSQKCRLTISLQKDVDNRRITIFDEQGKTLCNDTLSGIPLEKVIEGIWQPVKVSLCFDSDFRNYNKMWIYPGDISVRIGPSIRDLQFTGDPLNTHQQELMQILFANLDEMDMYDSLFSTLPEDAEEHAFYEAKLRISDSLYIEKSLLSCLKHPESYASLDVLKSCIGNPAMADPLMLRDLLNSLDDKLKKTKDYQRCQEVLNNPVRRYNPGDTLSSMLLKTADGLDVKLRNLLQKDFLYINFWSSSCSANTAEFKVLRKLLELHSDKLDIIGISLDEDPARFKSAVKSFALPWKQYCDFKGWFSPFVRSFNVHSIPSDVIISRKGVLIADNFNALEGLEYLEQLLSEAVYGKASEEKDSLILYFNLNSYELSKRHLEMLDSLVRVSKEETIQMNIYGYTDTLAEEAYNIVLSQKRADQVRKRLTQKELNPAKILACQGRGESGQGTNSGIALLKPEERRKVLIEMQKKRSPEPSAKPVKTDYTLNSCGIFGNPKIMKNLKVGDTLMFKFFGFERGGIIINYVFDFELKCFASAIKNRKTLKFYYHGYRRDAEPDYDINGKPLKPGELCRIRYEAFLSYLAAYNVESSRFSYIEGPDTKQIVRKPFEPDDWIDIFEHGFLTVKEL